MCRPRGSESGLGRERSLVKAAIAALTRVILPCYARDRTGSMRRFLSIIWVVALWATVASAQDETTTSGAARVAETEEQEDIADTEESAPEPSREEDLPPQLRAPPMQGLQLPARRMAKRYAVFSKRCDADKIKAVGSAAGAR